MKARLRRIGLGAAVPVAVALALAALSMSAPASGAIARAADEPICDGVTGDPHKNLATGEIEATLTVKCTQVTRQIEVYLFLDRDGTIAAKHAARNFDNKEGPPLTVATPAAPATGARSGTTASRSPAASRSTSAPTARPRGCPR